MMGGLMARDGTGRLLAALLVFLPLTVTCMEGRIERTGQGCGGSGTPPDTTPPAVLGEWPRPGEAWVDPGTSLTASFSEPLDPGSVAPSTFTVRDASNALHACTASYVETAFGQGVTWTPSARLAPLATYSAVVVAGVRDAHGNALPAEVSWSFTTGPEGVGAWAPTALLGAPASNTGLVGAWTGSTLVVWTTYGLAGGRYDPATGAWAPLSTTGAPSQRSGSTAVWTGKEMIVWGGERWEGSYVYPADGARYDPVTDAWTPVSTSGAPQGRSGHVAVWTGTEMIVWGGDAGYVYPEDGARYDPTTDTWTPIATSGAPAGRVVPSAVWTGSEMIVWGGSYIVAGTTYPTSTGGRYDPASDSWTATATAGAPEPRHLHAAVWTGTEMIVWGGVWPDPYAPSDLASGGRYDPVMDAWAATADSGAPTARWGHTAVWTGSRMVVWGGYSDGAGFGYPRYGGLYDPILDAWEPTAILAAPDGRVDHVAAWTGSEMIVWGGASGTPAGDGGRYVPP